MNMRTIVTTIVLLVSTVLLCQDNPLINQSHHGIAYLRSLKKSSAQFTKKLIDQGYHIKQDSILISTYINESDVKAISWLNESGANLKRVIRSDNYFAGYCDIDSLLSTTGGVAKFPSHINLHDTSEFTNNEGPTNINSASYETGGINPTNGTGLTIAIIDGGTEGYNNALVQGVVPAFTQYFNCSSGTCVSDLIPGATTGPCLGCDHGTNVAQILFDHAPAANYLYYRGGGSPLPVGTAAAIEHAIDAGADIISTSLSGYCTGWNDNSGILCSAVNTSGWSNVLMFFSSGNRNGGGHWQGQFVDNDGDGVHEWSAGDETNSRTTPVADGAQFNTLFQCDSPVDVYAVQFIDEPSNTVIETFDNLLWSSYENCRWTNDTGSPVNVGVRVISKSSSSQPNFEIHVHNAGSYEYSTNLNQTTSPANCVNNPNVITVAAVAQANYAQPDPLINPSSSQGPSNNSTATVDITGPTSNTVMDFTAMGTPFATGFGGTSCATPNVAGAVAAFWSRHPSLTASEVRQIVLDKASLFKDWGPSGNDNAFGAGGMFLFDYDDSNAYIHQGEGTNGVPPANGLFPWDNLEDVDNLAPPDRTVIMLTDDIVTPSKTIDKEMLITAPTGANIIVE